MEQTAEKLDCFVRVKTPENIEFEYTLAGPFQRFPAFLVDIFIRVAVFFGLGFVLTIGFGLSPFLAQVFGPFLVVGFIISFFLMSWFYGAFFETQFNGRTVGKMVFKLRTISIDGRPINGEQAALRNILRSADMCLLIPMRVFISEWEGAQLPVCCVGLVTMMLTRRMQRIGDLAAGTMVVSEQGGRLPLNLKPEDARVYGLAELIPANYKATGSMAQTVGLYMENRRRLTSMRRNDVARHLAGPLIQRFGLLPDTSPDLLLCAVYVRTYMSEEQREQGRQLMRKQAPAPGLLVSSPGVAPLATQVPVVSASVPPVATTPAAPVAASPAERPSDPGATNRSSPNQEQS